MTSGSHGRMPITAAFVYLLLLSLQFVPGSGVWAMWLLPLPLIVFHVNGLRRLTPFLAGMYILAMLLVGLNATAVVIGVAVYFISWVIGDSLQSSESPYPALITGAFVFIMLELVLLAFYRWSGGHLYADLNGLMMQAVHRDQARLGTSEQTAASAVSAFVTWLQAALPGVLCVIAILAAGVNLLLARAMSGNLAAGQPLLLDWHLPPELVVVYIVAIPIVLLNWFHSVSYVWAGVNSALVVTGFLLGTEGVSFLWRRIHQRPLAKLWLALMVIAAIVQIVRSVYVLLGLIDLIWRARRV